MLRDCSQAGHRIVTLMGASIVAQGDQKLLHERGVCRTCSTQVDRVTVIRDQGEWTEAKGLPDHHGVIFACVAIRTMAKGAA